MILSTDHDALHAALDEIGLGAAVDEGGSLLIKINLARPPEPGHPRTDPVLLGEVIRYAARHGARCAIAEAADGFLARNLARTLGQVGLADLVQDYQIRVLDLDLEDADCVTVDGELHYLPGCLKDYAVRVAMPATSKRPGMIFSNNVKLFVGAVPRRMYQYSEGDSARPKIHVDLHRSVANIYRAIMTYAPFHFFINGGKAMFDTPTPVGQGEVDLDRILVGSDGLELDQYVLGQFGLAPPDYIGRLVTSLGEKA